MARLTGKIAIVTGAARGGGSIVNVSSISGHDPAAGTAAYAASGAGAATAIPQ